MTMADTLQAQIARSLQAAEGQYYRLVLLVGQSGTGKTAVLHTVAAALDTDVVNVNLALSAQLLELTARQRTLRLTQILRQIVETGKPPAILDNLEILFDPALKQDPLRLLQGISRHRAVVASWNGAIARNKLMYAEPGHPEYRSYESGDTLIVRMSIKEPVDSTEMKTE